MVDVVKIPEVAAIAQLHFAASSDRDARAWVFSKTMPAMSVRGVRRFHPESRHSVTVFEQFDGRTPFIVDYESVVERRRRAVALRPTLILDSNLVDRLRALLKPIGPQETVHPNRAADREAAHAFLRFAISSNFDYNPFFQQIEAAAKTPDPQRARDFALRTAKAFVALHTLDETRFLETGEVAEDRNRLAEYEADYGVKVVDAIAERRVQALLETSDSAQVNTAVQPIYAVLLKIALLRTSRDNFAGKIGALREFVRDHLRVQVARETILAALHFTERETPLPRLEPTSILPKFLKEVRAAAWDLLFLRMPELLLEMDAPREINLGYLCTSEPDIAAIGTTCVVDLVASGALSRLITPALLSFNVSALHEVVGPEVEALMRSSPTPPTDLLTRYRQGWRAAEPEEVDALVRELESAVAGYIARRGK